MRRASLLAWLALYWLSGVAVASQGGALLESVADRLTMNSQLAGEFVQAKQLEFMDSPLASRGEFSLAVDQGLTWRVTEPIASTMTVRGSRVTLDGREMNDRGIGQLLGMIMQGFMAGDLSALEKNFDVSGVASAEEWHLVLVPRSKILRSALARLELTGERFLRRIDIIENNETQTRIEFSGVQAGELPGTDGDAGGH